MLASLFKTTSTSLVNLKQKTALNTSGISAPNWSAFELSEAWSPWGMDQKSHVASWSTELLWLVARKVLRNLVRPGERRCGFPWKFWLPGWRDVGFVRHFLQSVLYGRSVWSCLVVCFFSSKCPWKNLGVPWSWFRKGDMFVEVEEIMVTTAPTAVVGFISGHFGPKAIQK